MTKTLVWLSFPRSGTNHLTDLLAAVPGIASMTEIFDRGSVQVHSFQDRPATILHRLQALYQGFGIPVSFGGNSQIDINALMKSPDLVRAVHDRPGEALALLRQANGAALDSIKLFPRHLTGDQVHDLLGSAEIVPCVYLRNPLDTWISSLKRRQTGAFRGADTTGLKPVLSFGPFHRYLEQRAVWIRTIRQHADQIAVALAYEDLMRLGDDAARANWLRARLGLHGLAGCQGPLCPIRATTLQDRAAAAERKVRGWAEFMEACQTHAIDPARDLVDWPDMDRIDDESGEFPLA